MSIPRTREAGVEALQRVVERHDEVPAPSLPLGPAQVLGLQRTAGNAAVTRMIQRQLEVRRGGHVERFKRSDAAERYLNDRYEEKYTKKPGGKASERIEALAEDADIENEITRTWLHDALDHIHTGSKLKYERGYVDPSKSPAHHPMPARAEYRMGAGQPPSQMKAPGSPRSDPLPEQHMNVDADAGGLFASLGPKRNAMSASGKKNLYAYNVRAKYRLHQLQALPNGGFIETGPPSFHDAVAASATYQSAFTLYGSKTDVEDEMREGLDELAAEARQRPKSNKATFPHSETDKFTKTNADDKYKFSAAQPYAHSETQANSQVATEAPRIARALLDQMVRQAQAKTGLVEVVVQAQVLVGASDLHTVCGGACKHALCHITKEMEAALKTARHTYKAAFKAQGIYIRGSKELTTTTHIQGRQKYSSGFGKMNGLQMPTGVAGHGHVVEYQPRS